MIHPNDSYYFQPTSLPLPYAWSHAAPHVTGPSEHQNYYPQTYPGHHIQPWDDAVITHAQPVSIKRLDLISPTLWSKITDPKITNQNFACWTLKNHKVDLKVVNLDLSVSCWKNRETDFKPVKGKLLSSRSIGANYF